MEGTHRYMLKLDWTGSRQGPAVKYETYSREYRIEIDGKPALTGSSDPTFLGDPKLFNPEEMLLAALSSCHMLSYLALCVRSRIAVHSYVDDASGTMKEKAPHRMGLVDVLLRPRVTVATGTDLAKAKALHEKAHELCFIANSVNFPVRHEAEVSEAC